MNLKGKLAISGQPIGGGASSWDDLTGKPFSTVDTENGLTIQDDTLMIDTLDKIATIDYVNGKIDEVEADIPQADGTTIVDNNGVWSAVGGGTTSVNWDNIQNKPTFATVATSGDYDDLSNKPTIPSIDGLATETYVNNAIAAIDIPTDVSELNNDAGYVTSTEAQQTITALPDNSTIRWNSNNKLETVIGGGYETYTFSESDLPSGGLSLDANVFYYNGSGVNGYLYYSSSDNSALDAILSRSYKEGDSITVTSTIGSTTESATLYYSEDLGSRYYNARGFMVEGGITRANNIPQALIYTERVYSGSYIGCGVVFSNTNATLTIDSISGSPEYKVKVSKDWVEPNFPLDDRLFAGTNNAVKIGSDNGTADNYSLLIGNGENNNASNYSLALGTSSNSSAKINAREHSVAFGSVSQYGGIEAYSDSLAFGKSNGGTTITARKIFASAGSLAFGYRTLTKDIIAKSYSLAAGMATSSGNGLYAGTDGSSSKHCAIAVGTDVQATMNNSQAFGMYTLANSDNQMVLGKYNVADSSAKYGLIVGNGTSNSARSNSFAAGADGNIYIKGDIYTNVTDWTDPTNNSIKLANIPAPPTTDGNYTLAVTVTNGVPSYSWV